MSLSGSKETDKVSFSVNIGGCNSEESLSYAEDEDMDVPGVVEEIIEMLLTGLRDTVCPLDRNLLKSFIIQNL